MRGSNKLGATTGLPVTLGPSKRVNAVAMLAGGGAYHTGVEVYSSEYCFGTDGVDCQEPY